MSYLKIGWQWLRQQFHKGWPKINWFWLDPSPDPEPAIASRKKAGQKKRVWTILHQRPPTPPQHQELSLQSFGLFFIRLFPQSKSLDLQFK